MKALSAYEFTRFDADFTAKEKTQYYDLRAVEFLIEYRAKGVDLRKTDDYKECKDTFIELTMSGDLEEAISWMEYWMANAMAYGNQTRNLDWRTKFLAAYDIHEGLLKHRPRKAKVEKPAWVDWY